MKNSRDSFGVQKLTFVDRFGTWLSRILIADAIKGIEIKSVLEIGCGYHARNLMALSPIAEHFTGIDFSVSEIIKSNPKFEIFEGSIEECLTSIEHRPYDAILIISVLEHLNDPLAILEKCKKMLPEGGVLLVNVPTWSGKFFLEFSAFRLGLSPKIEMDDHKMYYSKRDLWPLLVKAGFKPSKINLRYKKFGLNLFGTITK